LGVFFAGNSFVKILPEVSTKGLTKTDMPMLMEKLQKIMQNEYEILSKESAVENKIKIS
jgi:lysophosphatidate acyltransferase